MLPPCSEQALDELLARKEEEWRALQAHRTRLQEAALQDTHSQLEDTQRKLQRLREDFVYNLQVLEERDLELERYDAAFAQSRGRDEARQAEVSELKIEVAKLKQALTQAARRTEELQQQHQHRLQELCLELERVHSDKNGEINHHREQYENLKWRLERKLEELDGELALQRQELLLEFESEMQKREHEFRLQADSMSNAVLSQELKVKLLNKELEALKEAGVKAAECMQKAETANSELEKKLQHQARALQDLEAVKNARIKDLENKLHSVQLTRKKEEETFKRKHEELDRLARERDEVLAAMKGAHREQLQVLEAKVRELQAHCKALEAQLHRAEWRQADAARERDAVADRLREDASALKCAWDAQVAQMSKEMTSKDLQLQMLQEEEVKLKAQLAGLQQDIGRYKQQLSLAVEREQSLQREQVQLGLDWQRRCDDIERDQIQKSEALIQGLTAARDQVAAKLQEAERVLQGQEMVLKAVTLERDQAVQALRMPRSLGLGAQMLLRQHEEEVTKDFPSGEIQQLQEQNTSLRNAIAQMRREMETLSGQTLLSAQLGRENSGTNQPDPKAGGDTATPDYVLAFEAEIQNLKDKFKVLEEHLGDVLDPWKISSSHMDTQASTHAWTEAPGSVQARQVSTGLALRKLGDRVHLLNLLVTRLRKKVLQKPLELDTVQHELPHEMDQVHLEVLELRTQVAELGAHLTVAWQEGREPSGQKQPQASNTAALRKEGTGDGAPMLPEGPEELSIHLQTSSVHQLQRKLKEAARKILSLLLEKEQLIEMGNRLRAELGRPKGKPPRYPLPPSPEAQSPGVVASAPQPHLTAQDADNAKKGWFSEDLGKSRPHLPQMLSREDTTQGHKAAAGLSIQKQHRIPTVTCKPAPQKENRSPKPLQDQEFSEKNGHSQRSSSLASSSLQDTWKLLDLGSSPSGLTSQDDATPGLPGSPAAPDFAIRGIKVSAQSKAKPTRTSKYQPAEARGSRRPLKALRGQEPSELSQPRNHKEDGDHEARQSLRLCVPTGARGKLAVSARRSGFFIRITLATPTRAPPLGWCERPRRPIGRYCECHTSRSARAATAAWRGQLGLRGPCQPAS
ncbi:coiled-coil domain-containing protein 57 isoform X2 [Nycticebus coucang]|uniref:coiled-coil domain-containing protein 57 isoform X2 n=1 Tax=Nycticebus coucang TaxID=9470 RepID=UPI00234CB2C6|nr:coiled-coil domain-containing protein 57 isoform X2 [Nycticebus coucang]